MPRIPDISGGIITDGVGSAPKRAPSGDIGLADEKLNTGGTGRMLSGSAGMISNRAALNIRAPQLRAGMAKAMNVRTPKDIPLVDPNVIRHVSSQLSQAAFRYQDQKDTMAATDALLDVTDRMRIARTGIKPGTPGAPKEGIPGYLATKDKNAIDMHSGYMEKIEGIYFGAAGELEGAAKAKFLAQAIPKLNRHREEAARHRVQQEEVHKQHQYQRKVQHTMADIEENPWRMLQEDEGGLTQLDRTVAEAPTPAHQLELREELYSFAIRKVVSSGGLEAAKGFDIANGHKNTPEGRLTVTKWLTAQDKAAGKEEKRNEKAKIKAVQFDVKVNMPKRLEEDLVRVDGEVFFNRLKGIAKELAYDGVGENGELVDSGLGYDQYQMDIKEVIGKTLKGHFARTQNAGVVEELWNATVKDYEKRSGELVDANFLSIGNDVIKSLSKEQAKYQIVNEARAAKATVGSIIAGNFDERTLSALNTSTEKKELFQSINSIREAEMLSPPDKVTNQSREVLYLNLSQQVEDGGFTASSGNRDNLLGLAAAGDITSDRLNDLLEEADQYDGGGKKKKKDYSQLKDVDKAIDELAKSGNITGKVYLSSSAKDYKDDPEKIGAQNLEIMAYSRRMKLNLRRALEKDPELDTSEWFNKRSKSLMEMREPGNAFKRFFDMDDPGYTERMESIEAHQFSPEQLEMVGKMPEEERKKFDLLDYEGKMVVLSRLGVGK